MFRRLRRKLRHGFRRFVQSTRCANAIVQALVSSFGVDKSRLFPFGCSFASPAAPNTSEEGRAKNRRVELVRWN